MGAAKRAKKPLSERERVRQNLIKRGLGDLVEREEARGAEKKALKRDISIKTAVTCALSLIELMNICLWNKKSVEKLKSDGRLCEIIPDTVLKIHPRVKKLFPEAFTAAETSTEEQKGA